MMYINIKNLYSWRIRPYKIPSFIFPLLFPFFSLFSSLFFFPPFCFLPRSWCASVPQLLCRYLEQDSSGLVGQSSPFKSILSIQSSRGTRMDLGQERRFSSYSRTSLAPVRR